MHDCLCPNQLTECLSLHPSALNGIGMSGTIPASLGSLTVLTNMCVRDDALPPSARLVSAPHRLPLPSQLNGTSLTGTIPSTLGSLTAVTWLCVPHRLGRRNPHSPVCLSPPSSADAHATPSDLNTTSLTGTIPSTLGSLTAVNYLYVPVRTAHTLGRAPAPCG